MGISTCSAKASLGEGDTISMPVKVLQEYLKIPSVSGSEREAAMYFRSICELNGLHIRLFTDTDSSYNFSASLFPLSANMPNVILQHHTDVVTAGDATDWKYGPYNGTIKDGYLNGRGALDCKGLGVMQLFGLLKYRAQIANAPNVFNITLLVVSGEESGGKNGSDIITSQYISELNPVAVFGEGGAGTDKINPDNPSQLFFGISIAEKSNLWLELELKVKTFGHGSTPPRNSANKMMIRALNKINDIQGPIDFNKTTKRMFREMGTAMGGYKGFIIKHINWFIMRPLAIRVFESEPVFDALVRNTTILTHVANPPGPVNQIPEKITAFLDCRLLPGVSKRKFIRQIKTDLFLEPGVQIKVLDEGPASEESDPNSEFYTAMSRAIKSNFPSASILPVLFNASTDNNYFRRLGIPTFGVVPAFMLRSQMESIHNVDECVSLENIETGIAVYSQFITEIMKLTPDPSRLAAKGFKFKPETED